ncbi:tagaturonate epimerase family protein [Truepera radiovictrix]|uniref:Tagaturonate/fructuronate epimerase n=1 Tax=Truepera radiovictrix (strain DSM 17093 / CIP 108686 / LMG 22925 / RQ-24) TaxID=649638 RepID=D7CTE2_TRURR|nr:tagaturonate epimerase family protein [Truepera radiovictrix]ADI13799.1 conserved hypothetical protein [Truepera radiovictrix DSM 17093]WMT57636.1 tagaturonate epimerase family protein [Truepera radiovictrix]
MPSQLPEPLPVPPEARAHPSFRLHEGAALWLAGARLAVLAPPEHPALTRFRGEVQHVGDHRLLRAERRAENAAALRALLPDLQPRPLGLVTSAGFGDRLGVATPGHVRAAQRYGAGVAPVFAQQSIREMTRTGRTPQEVLDDATWGAFAAGWRGALGADADHQKTVADLERCAAAGFTLFTVDPSDHVDDSAHGAPASDLEAKVAALPWRELETTRADFERYAGRRLELGDRELVLAREAVLRAGAKYARAVLHVATLYRHLEGKGAPFELEVSVDETATPTSHAEHAVVALELRRLGVRWVGLAPRFVGRFEKGVDYRGDLGELKADLAGHAALARSLGPYKLSLHSGSDKFSVYPLIAEATGGMVHLKTAGTSYLEALRVAAQVAPGLFREILTLGRERFAVDKQSYHISAALARVSEADTLTDDELPRLLDDDDARQVLHVTFGSALDRYRAPLLRVLEAHDEAYQAGLAAHFAKHLTPFAEVAP